MARRQRVAPGVTVRESTGCEVRRSPLASPSGELVWSGCSCGCCLNKLNKPQLNSAIPRRRNAAVGRKRETRVTGSVSGAKTAVEVVPGVPSASQHPHKLIPCVPDTKQFIPSEAAAQQRAKKCQALLLLWCSHSSAQ